MGGGVRGVREGGEGGGGGTQTVGKGAFSYICNNLEDSSVTKRKTILYVII